jgi:hypothetical protein
MRALYWLILTIPLVVACGSGKGSANGSETALPFGTADCRVECENLTDTVIQVWEEGRGGEDNDESNAILYREQCQEMPNHTTCEECIFQVSSFLIENWGASPDCACYFEQTRDVPWTSDSELCDEIIAAYGGNAALMADDCQTCWTDQSTLRTGDWTLDTRPADPIGPTTTYDNADC